MVHASCVKSREGKNSNHSAEKILLDFISIEKKQKKLRDAGKKILHLASESLYSRKVERGSFVHLVGYQTMATPHILIMRAVNGSADSFGIMSKVKRGEKF